MEYVGWLFGTQLCDGGGEGEVFNNLTAVELEVKANSNTNNNSICFTFSDNITSICINSKGHHQTKAVKDAFRTFETEVYKCIQRDYNFNKFLYFKMPIDVLYI